MKILVACEFTGTVRDAFIKRGHNAISCDLLPSLTNGPHYEGDVRDILYDDWDMIIAHPPCTYLTVAGNRWYHDKLQLIEEAFQFVKLFIDHPCEKIAIENPVGRLSTLWRKPDQYIQPWQFGHGETKKTGLWLKELPKLLPTNIVDGREQRIWKMGPKKGINRGLERSKTYQGIADAMAEQWG